MLCNKKQLTETGEQKEQFTEVFTRYFKLGSYALCHVFVSHLIYNSYRYYDV